MYISFERYKKNIKLILVLILLLLVLGCGTNLTPKELEYAKPPIKIIAITEKGIMLVDKDNIIYSYSELYSISQIIMNSEMKPGDILIPESKRD